MERKCLEQVFLSLHPFLSVLLKQRKYWCFLLSSIVTFCVSMLLVVIWRVSWKIQLKIEDSHTDCNACLFPTTWTWRRARTAGFSRRCGGLQGRKGRKTERTIEERWARPNWLDDRSKGLGWRAHFWAEHDRKNPCGFGLSALYWLVDHLLHWHLQGLIPSGDLHSLVILKHD